MMRIIVISFFSFIALITLVFALLNFHLVEINLYVTTFQMPLALALSIELLLGIVIGFLAAFMHIIKLKSQYKSLNKQVALKAKQEKFG